MNWLPFLSDKYRNAHDTTVCATIRTYKEFMVGEMLVTKGITGLIATITLAYQLSITGDIQLLKRSGNLVQRSINPGTTAESISVSLAPDIYYIKNYPKKLGENTTYNRTLMDTPIAPLTTSKVESGATASPLSDRPATSTDAAIKGLLLGIYYGNQGWNMEQVHALESWQDKKNAVVEIFTNWANDTNAIDNLFNQQLPNIWNNKNIPIMTWEPFTGNSDAPNDIVVQIANGKFDAYINSWAERLKIFLAGPDGAYNTGDDRRVYLRLAHEMNGNWYPWSSAKGGSSPGDYVRMWKHVKDIFNSKKLDANHVQWVWTVNRDDIGGYKAEQFYPGDAYVDWVAIDGYNWGTSQTWSKWEIPDEVFTPMISRVRAITRKPLAITEVGSSTKTQLGSNAAAKSQWIIDFLNYAAAKDVKMICWFNEDKETDWAIFGGGNGYSSYKYNNNIYKRYSTYSTGIISSRYSASDPTNPRLLSDEQFYGVARDSLR